MGTAELVKIIIIPHIFNVVLTLQSAFVSIRASRHPGKGVINFLLSVMKLTLREVSDLLKRSYNQQRARSSQVLLLVSIILSVSICKNLDHFWSAIFKFLDKPGPSMV